MPPKLSLCAAVVAVVLICGVVDASRDVESMKQRFTAFASINKFCPDANGQDRACVHDNGVCCENSSYCCPAGHDCVSSSVQTMHCHTHHAASESSVPASRTSESSHVSAASSAAPLSSVSLPMSRSVESSMAALGSSWSSIGSSALPSLSSLSPLSSSHSSHSSHSSGSSHHESARSSHHESAHSSHHESAHSSHRHGSKKATPQSRRPRSINVVNHIILNTTPNPVVASGANGAVKPSVSPKFKAINPSAADVQSAKNTIPLASPAQKAASARLRGVPHVA